MISKRTILLLLGAIFASVPLVLTAHKSESACIATATVPATVLRHARVARAVSTRPHLLRAQMENENDQRANCATQPNYVFLKVLELVALGLWAGSIGSAFVDVRDWRRAKRRGRRRRSASMGSGVRNVVRSERDQAD